MQLRPRCQECRSTSHLVCQPVQTHVQQTHVQQTPVQVPARIRSTSPKCCSFCSRPGHYKPRCEKYKSFIELIRPDDLGEHAEVVIQAFYADMQNIFIRFLKTHYTNAQNTGLFNSSDDQFRALVKMFVELYQTGYFMLKTKLKKKTKKIVVKLCKTSVNVSKECGICLTEDIHCSNMVKLGCGHELCGHCVKRIIDVKPCCAFCRANIENVSVNSEAVFNILNAK
jgi:hypothetical protein